MTFALGHLELKDMIKSGILVTLVYIVVVVSLNLLLVPLFKAYTVIV